MNTVASGKRRHEDESDSADGEIHRKIARTVSTPGDSSLASTPQLGQEGVQRLLRMLDLTELTDHMEILDRFYSIARILLHEVIVRVGAPSEESSLSGKRRMEDYEFVEVEFYLRGESHEDPFTHGEAEQGQSGNWYFHRAPRRKPVSPGELSTAKVSNTPAAGYRGGTRKGMDLTFGGPVSTSLTSRFFSKPDASSAHNKGSIRGGILIRTLRRRRDGKVISGPSLVVDEILRASDAKSIAELVNRCWGGNTSATTRTSAAANLNGHSLRLVSISDVTTPNLTDTAKPHIYSSPRIGLDLSHSSIPAALEDALNHPRIYFISRSYRYFIRPELLLANGRGHTLLGVYNHILGDQSTQDDSKATIDDQRIFANLAETTALKVPTIAKYLQNYWSGMDSGTLAPFLGQKGKGAGSAPATALTLFGTLNRLEKTKTAACMDVAEPATAGVKIFSITY